MAIHSFGSGLVAVALFTAGACGSVEKIPNDFTIAVAKPDLFIRRGETQTVAVTVQRRSGTSDIPIEASGLPAGVTIEPLTIAGGDAGGMLTLHASATATEGVAMLSVRGQVDEAGATAPLHLLVGGAPGTLDESFGSAGTFITNIPGMVLVGRGLVLAADGGAVLTGATGQQSVTVKLRPDGMLDPAFGSNGVVSTGSGAFSEGIAATTLPDGHVIVAGVGNGLADFSDFDFGLFSYTATGVLDTTFGASGVATFSPGTGPAELHTVAVAADGSLFVAGAFFGTPSAMRGLKFSKSGVRDATFDINEAGVNPQSSFVQADGKLVISGSLNGDVWMARYGSNGAKDVGFGTGGVVTTDLAPETISPFSVSVVPITGGKIMAVGFTTAAPTKVVLLRYNANGSLDITFGVGGKVLPSVPFSTRSPSAIAVDADGKILYAGVSNGKPTILRFGSDGMPDPMFGMAGLAVIDFAVPGSTQQTGAWGVVIDKEGRILFTGEVGAAGSQHMIAGRLWF